MPERPALLQLGKVSERMAERLVAGFEVVQLPPDHEAFLAERGSEFAAIATMRGVPDDVLAELPNLKVISSFGVGYDNIDAVVAASRGILVAHTPDVLNDEVSDTAIMLWLAVSKELLPAERWARSGAWETKGAYPLARTVRGRNVGILGLGRIGQAIAKMTEMFGAKVHYHGRARKNVPYLYFDDLADMASEVDVLFVITPGGKGTRHLVNAEVLGALGPKGILINVSRGSVVDEVALVAALREGRLGAAGLDVFEDEPRIPDALKDMENVVLLPHIGSATVETRRAMGDLVCDNLDAWLADGKVVTPVPECLHLNKQ